MTDKKLHLLDEVIQRFTDKQEHAEMRARVAGTASPRTLPVQKLGMIMPVYERTPRVTERMQSLPGGGGSSSQMVGRPGGKPKRPQKSYDNIPGAFTGGGARSTRVKDGKAELVATMSSTQPVFRELKSFELARPAGSILARDRYDTYDAKDRSEEGEGQGKKDFTMELMMTMDSDNLGWLKREFAKFRDELDIYQFVYTMQQHIDKTPLSAAERVEIVAHLKELFDQVDVNGDKKMEWAELTSFIIESQTTGGPLSEAPLTVYKPIPTVQDETRLRSEQSIERVFYLPGLDLLLLCERPSAVVSVYSPLKSPCRHEIREHKAEVLAVEHVPECGCVVTSGADLALCFWDATTPTSPSWRLRQKTALQHSQMALCWCASRGELYTGSADGMLYAWDVVNLCVVQKLPGHEDAITCLILMKQRKELLASGSLDKCIRLWDVGAQKPSCVYTLGPPKVGLAPFGRHFPSNLDSDTWRCHERGVSCLAFSPQQRHLFSGGLDHELLVWNPMSERVICNLRQHTSPLSTIEAVDDSPMVVSADVSGLLCIWDSRSLTCSQKLQVNVPPGTELQSPSMALVPRHHMIVTAARRLSSFRGPEEPDAFLTDADPIACGLYNNQAQSFCTASGTSVMMWDASTGQLARRYDDVTPTPITAICLDDRERKLLVADHAGNILVLNYQSGAIMKKMVRHHGQISSLLYIPERRYVVATSWDRTVTLQDESEQDEGKLLKSMPSGHACDVTTAAFSYAHSLLATGGDDGGLQIWRLDERTIPHPHYELRGHTHCITALAFLEPWPLLASADSTGTVRIWTTSFTLPQMRYRQLLQMKNQAAKGLWLAPWMRAATVQFNSRNTDGTLSVASESEVASSKKISGIEGVIGTSRSLVGANISSIRVGKGALGSPASKRPSPSSSPSPAAAVPPPAVAAAPAAASVAASGGGLGGGLEGGSCFLTDGVGGGGSSSPPPPPAPAAAASQPLPSGKPSSDDERTWPEEACAVTSLCFAPERKSLIWGDDLGRIIVWDLKPLLDALPPPPPQALSAAAAEEAAAVAAMKDEDPIMLDRMRRTSRASREEEERPVSPRAAEGRSATQRNAGRLAEQAKETAWLIAKLQGKTVHVRHVWQAHKESISSISTIRRPPAVFSTGFDRMAYVWKHDGSQCYGSLRRGGLKGAQAAGGTADGVGVTSVSDAEAAATAAEAAGVAASADKASRAAARALESTLGGADTDAVAADDDEDTPPRRRRVRRNCILSEALEGRFDDGEEAPARTVEGAAETSRHAEATAMAAVAADAAAPATTNAAAVGGGEATHERDPAAAAAAAADKPAQPPPFQRRNTVPIHQSVAAAEAAALAASAVLRGEGQNFATDHDAAEKWRFPFDTRRTVVKNTIASSIVHTIESEAFRKSRKALHTPVPSEDGAAGMGGTNLDGESDPYQPLTSLELSHKAWLASRSPTSKLGQRTRPDSADPKKSDGEEDSADDADADEASVEEGLHAVVDELCSALQANHGRVIDFFKQIDSNGDGTIGIGELEQALGALGFFPSPSELEFFFTAIDTDGSGEIDYSELYATLRRRADKKLAAAARAARAADRAAADRGDADAHDPSLAAPTLDDGVAAGGDGGVEGPSLPPKPPAQARPQAGAGAKASPRTRRSSKPMVKEKSAAQERLDRLLAADMPKGKSAAPAAAATAKSGAKTARF